MKIFWGEGFLKGVITLLFFVVIVLLCWGWVTNVAMGRMTTRQYLNMLYSNFQKGVTAASNEVQKRMGRVAHNTQTWYGPGGSQE